MTRLRSALHMPSRVPLVTGSAVVLVVALSSASRLSGIAGRRIVGKAEWGDSVSQMKSRAPAVRGSH